MSLPPMIGSKSPVKNDDGFTLIETLIALMVLSLSMGLFVQSLSLATAQLKSTKDILAAEVLAKKIQIGRASCRERVLMPV